MNPGDSWVGGPADGAQWHLQLVPGQIRVLQKQLRHLEGRHSYSWSRCHDEILDVQNAIRHNLSLHKYFKRMQTPKGWVWVVDSQVCSSYQCIVIILSMMVMDIRSFTSGSSKDGGGGQKRAGSPRPPAPVAPVPGPGLGKTLVIHFIRFFLSHV